MSPAVRKDLSFTQIPEWVLFHEQLSAQAVRLYGVLARYADKEGQSHYSRAKLAEAINVRSVDTVDRAVKELVEHAALTVEERFDEAGDRTSNLYTVHVAPPEGVAARMRLPTPKDAATRGRTDAATVAAQNPQELEPFEVEPLTPSLRGDSTSPRSARDNQSSPTTTATSQAETGAEPGVSVSPRCPKHASPHSNCRGCGTTARQLEEQQRRAAEARRRQEAVEATAAERAQRTERQPADPAVIQRVKNAARGPKAGV